jgi:hypothetical protein
MGKKKGKKKGGSQKSMGRAVNSLPHAQYMTAHGATVQSANATGINFTNFEVAKYFKQLRLYAVNRLKWRSDTIPEHELKLIEWHLFNTGYCAVLRPKVSRRHFVYTSPHVKVFECALQDLNNRTGRPNKISISTAGVHSAPIDIHYDKNDFVIITDEYLFPANALPHRLIAWEYACKLHELDLAFNANSHRNRLPFIFNNGSSKAQNNEQFNNISVYGVSIAELMRSAMGRNEQFVEVPERAVGESGFMHEPRYVENNLKAYMECQRYIKELYFEDLGLYTQREQSGVYTVKALQKEGDETGEYRTDVLLEGRLSGAKEAAQKFNVQLSLEVV